MIYVLKVQDTNDVIVFDSIEGFSEGRNGQVTSHPVEDGTRISDHIIVDNKRIKLQGVVSDYNFFNPVKDYLNFRAPEYTYNRTEALNRADKAGNFTKEGVDVPSAYARPDAAVMGSMQAVKDKLEEVHTKKLLLTVLRYATDGKGSVIDPLTNCVLTDLSFNERPDGGYALYCDLSLEQITTVTVQVLEASAPKIVPTALADAAAAGAAKGGGKGNAGTKVAQKPVDQHEGKLYMANSLREEYQCRLLMEKQKAINGAPPECQARLGLQLGF